MKNYAVRTKNAYKSYGSKKVLDGLNIKVSRGCIYALLGASGCGKTTLLNCILGTKVLDSGEVWTLGGKPGSEKSGVPGPRVGYMPQETALVAEFTVEDAIYYFGRIFNMEDTLISDQFQKFKTLLHLPPDSRYLRNCSGGELRRVSFACALVHNPELLILDEPTVGLDPLLRERIWNYLIELAHTEKTAIILTTHYIEEARYADKIGLMRNGRLIAQDNPEHLLETYNSETLEDVFLKLSKLQDEENLESSSDGSGDFQPNQPNSAPAQVPNVVQEQSRAWTLNGRRSKSLLVKNTKQFIRNVSGLVFTFTFPLLQMFCFLAAVGGDIKGIPLAVINEDGSLVHCKNYTKSGTAIPYDEGSCEFHDLGCRFIDEIQDPMFDLKYYDNFDKAIEDSKHGHVVGVMYMSDNLSHSYSERLNSIFDLPDELVNNSQIQVWLDMSNRQIGETIKYTLMHKYSDFEKNILKDCNLPTQLGDLPMRFKYEYGNRDDTYTSFVVPGFILGINVFLGTMLTVSIIITDRLEGIWDRSIVAGVTSLEITLTHFLVQFIVVFIQTIEMVVITFVIFRIDYVGSIFSIFGFLLLQGVTGMVLGFLISVVTDSHIFANLCATGFFYPTVLICGAMWPLEGQPAGMRFFSQLMPFTLPTQALRDIIRKGYGLESLEVWSGVLVSFAWLILMTIFSVLGIQSKR